MTSMFCWGLTEVKRSCNGPDANNVKQSRLVKDSRRKNMATPIIDHERHWIRNTFLSLTTKAVQTVGAMVATGEVTG